MNQDTPQTHRSLVADLRRLGLMPGRTVLVHSSLRSLGWVCGGSQAVVAALQDVVGPEGTVVVPTQTSDNSDPAKWAHPPVPEHWWPIIREEMPAFDPQRTPTRAMGAIAEQVRTSPGAVRSAHPQTSFAAIGARAREIVDTHPLACALGPDSPLGTLERLDADVLLLGVGYDSCTAFHLAEYRQPAAPVEQYGAAVQDEAGERVWRTWTDVVLDEEDFERIGADFETTGAVCSGPVGDSTSRLFPLRDAVAYGAAWMAEHRQPAR
ncbi:aminoglycoside N(3)-acetyltransferase [Microbacterium sp. CIAB417]|uniref:aminoglycoside N(3)-acetyltransferase n=1 Tax=Microbacterium sp. CIAB417 TaxID=2860287 RepID=UPI001FABFEBA|nr:AAC(3) family N-acetyltransferase [Microbacterium sp. CIAB417]